MTDLDETPVTVTLPTYVAAALRGAARAGARAARRKADRQGFAPEGDGVDLNEHRAAALDAGYRALDAALAVDPRDPDHSRPGIFAYHNCWRCHDGAERCVVGNPSACEFPRARND